MSVKFVFVNMFASVLEYATFARGHAYNFSASVRHAPPARSTQFRGFPVGFAGPDRNEEIEVIFT